LNKFLFSRKFHSEISVRKSQAHAICNASCHKGWCRALNECWEENALEVKMFKRVCCGFFSQLFATIVKFGWFDREKDEFLFRSVISDVMKFVEVSRAWLAGLVGNFAQQKNIGLELFPKNEMYQNK
jgi:hypothetical protein